MIKYNKNEWDAAKASGVGSGNYVVPIGGYICAINDVKDDESKNCAVFDFDIVKGEYDHFFSKKFAEDTKTRGSNAFWQGRFYCNYDKDNISRWKGLITSFERSNPGKFTWNPEAPDLSKMKNKLIGLIISQREKSGKEGGVFLNNYVVAYKSVESIENGDFKLPEIKRLDGATVTKASSVKNDPIPDTDFEAMFPSSNTQNTETSQVDTDNNFNWDDDNPF